MTSVAESFGLYCQSQACLSKPIKSQLLKYSCPVWFVPNRNMKRSLVACSSTLSCYNRQIHGSGILKRDQAERTAPLSSRRGVFCGGGITDNEVSGFGVECAESKQLVPIKHAHHLPTLMSHFPCYFLSSVGCEKRKNVPGTVFKQKKKKKSDFYLYILKHLGSVKVKVFFFPLYS